MLQSIPAARPLYWFSGRDGEREKERQPNAHSNWDVFNHLDA